MKEPWGPNTPWKNKTAFFTYLRGCLRKAWSKNPIKLDKIKKERYKIPNPNPKGRVKEVWGFCCAMCGNEYPIKECQVDHINPAGKLNSTEDIEPFVKRLLYITEDDIRLVCKSCNSALAMSDKQGVTFEEARKRKKVIEFGKQSLTEQKKQLSSLNLVPVKDTKKACTEAYEKYLNEGDVI